MPAEESRETLHIKNERHAHTRTTFKMPGELRLGAPTLRVGNAGIMKKFYVEKLGLAVKREFKDTSDSLNVTELGFESSSGKSEGETVIVLKDDPEAVVPPHDFAGLYHYALLVPDRRSLASTYLALEHFGARYDGFANHTFSESLYLHDVENNGIEIYADRPRSEWPDWGRMTDSLNHGDMSALNIMTRPLDLGSLLRELNGLQSTGVTSFPAGAVIGHMHLRVTDLERSVKFYHEKLGLDVKAYIPQIGAAFLSAGGYHHHLGLNTWHSGNGSPHRTGYSGLDSFTFIVPDRHIVEELAAVIDGASVVNGKLTFSDPDGIVISVEA